MARLSPASPPPHQQPIMCSCLHVLIILSSIYTRLCVHVGVSYQQRGLSISHLPCSYGWPLLLRAGRRRNFQGGPALFLRHTSPLDRHLALRGSYSKPQHVELCAWEGAALACWRQSVMCFLNCCVYSCTGKHLITYLKLTFSVKKKTVFVKKNLAYFASF